MTSKDCRLTRFELDTWDDGRVIVNHAFAELFQRDGWSTFDSIWAKSADAAVAKNLRTDRVTLRFTLDDSGIQRAFYIKRHQRSSWKEYIKPLLRLTWPILGARNEWNAILDFHEVGLPTMVPVAFGESGENSFLITEALERCAKLSELAIDGQTESARSTVDHTALIRRIALVAKAMHGAGLHHQDFYLGHLMQSETDPGRLFVIDLGRVQKHKRLSKRWIVKDLAQLNYSADVTDFERLRFLREYLGRPITKHDLSLINQIQAKSARIGRHSKKNRL